MEVLGFRLAADPRLLTRAIRLLGGHLSHLEASQPAAMAIDGDGDGDGTAAAPLQAPASQQARETQGAGRPHRLAPAEPQCSLWSQNPEPGTSLSLPHSAQVTPATPTPPTPPLQVETLLSTIILPALACLPCNPGIANELWHLLQPMAYPARFRVYSAFKGYSSGAEAPPEVAAGCAGALSDTKKVLRRLSRENVKEFGRRLAKPAHSNPILVGLTLITQVGRRATPSASASASAANSAAAAAAVAAAVTLLASAAATDCLCVSFRTQSNLFRPVPIPNRSRRTAT